MAFLKSKRSQFIAWMFIYAFGVMLMTSKAGDEGWFFLWGLAAGTGAGIATSIRGPQEKLRRLGIVSAWLGGLYLLTFPILWSHLGSDAGWLPRAEHALVITLLAGGPALLALLVWIFRRPKSEGAAAAAPSA